MFNLYLIAIEDICILVNWELEIFFNKCYGIQKNV